MSIVIVFLGIVIFFVVWRFNDGKRKINQQHLKNPSSFEAFVSAAEFNDMVLATSSKTPVMVDFYADWCNPCKAFAPILTETVNEYGGSFLLAKVDVEANRKLAKKYDIQSMPTILLFKQGKCIHRFSGGMSPHSLRYVLATNEIQKFEETEKS